ncbi:MAG: UDP-N-acetylmuramate dehydrogenase [Gammaproteobacteria bacterium]|nr:UDP-N-acetylmuramate dehydrogenase [Gammaproteobacteria bacterium]
MSVWDSMVAEGFLDHDVSLGPLTTYKLGGTARYLATVEDEGALERIARHLAMEPVDVVVFGRGSNILVSDEGFDGLVVRLGAGFSWVRIGESVSAGSATPLPLLAREAAKAGRRGLEFFVGIPGSVGGAIRMNAGCHGSETRDRLVSATVIDLATGTSSRFGPSDLDLSYRHSRLGPLEIVTRAEFSTEPGERAAGEKLIRDITRWRKEHQPGGVLSAGSVFKNPPGDSAGRLIDEAGLKGLAIGGARVSMLHANFIEAGPEATAADVHALIRDVQHRLQEMGVALEPEVRFVGRFEDDV